MQACKLDRIKASVTFKVAIENSVQTFVRWPFTEKEYLLMKRSQECRFLVLESSMLSALTMEAIKERCSSMLPS